MGRYGRRTDPAATSTRALRRGPPGSRSDSPRWAPRETRPGSPTSAGDLAQLQPEAKHCLVVYGENQVYYCYLNSV